MLPCHGKQALPNWPFLQLCQQSFGAFKKWRFSKNLSHTLRGTDPEK
jgi:hypothetical protein